MGSVEKFLRVSYPNSQTCCSAWQLVECGAVDLPKLLRQLMPKENNGMGFTVLLYVDNRSLEGTVQPSYWKHFVPWVEGRCGWIGPFGELIAAAL